MLKAAGDAIADLAIDNFFEVRDQVASPLLLARKKLEKFLSGLFPRAFVPLYDLPSFSNLPYQEAREWARRQDRVLVGAAAAAAAAVVAGLGARLTLLL